MSNEQNKTTEACPRCGTLATSRCGLVDQGREVYFSHEVILGGLRFDAGNYLITRIGPSKKEAPLW